MGCFLGRGGQGIRGWELLAGVGAPYDYASDPWDRCPEGYTGVRVGFFRVLGFRSLGFFVQGSGFRG